MARMVRCSGQPANFMNQLFPADLPRFIRTFSFGQLSDRRSASHHWNATSGAKPNIRNALAFSFPALKAKREFKNVSANRILEPCAAIRRLNFTRVARMLEMVQQFGGIHSSNCNAAAGELAPRPGLGSPSCSLVSLVVNELDDHRRTSSPTIERCPTRIILAA